MLIPRYSMRRMFWVTSVLAVFFAIVSWAVQGHVWAIALAAAIGCLGLMLVVQAIVFGIVWSTSQLLRSLNVDTKSLSYPDHGTPTSPSDSLPARRRE